MSHDWGNESRLRNGFCPVLDETRSRVTQTTSSARADALLRAAPVIDGHNDLPWALRNLLGSDARAVINGIDLTEPQPNLHTDLGRLRRGGVGGPFWSVFVPCELTGRAAGAAGGGPIP